MANYVLELTSAAKPGDLFTREQMSTLLAYLINFMLAVLSPSESEWTADCEQKLHRKLMSFVGESILDTKAILLREINAVLYDIMEYAQQAVNAEWTAVESAPINNGVQKEEDAVDRLVEGQREKYQKLVESFFNQVVSGTFLYAVMI